ncbi:protein-tyrosine-phosphatase, partial [Rhizobium ruizarguesonis]
MTAMERAADVEEGKRPGAFLFMSGMNAIRSPIAEAIARSI